MRRTFDDLHDWAQATHAEFGARAPVPEPTGPELTWELCKDHATARAAVPGGWLVKVSGGDGVAMTFLPDPDHAWGRSDE